MLNLFEHIAYTEQKENHGTMILDGVLPPFYISVGSYYHVW